MGLATNLFGWVVDKYAGEFKFVKDHLPSSDIKLPFRTYVSWVFMLTAASLAISAIATPIFLLTVDLGVQLPILVFMIIFIPLIVSATTFITFFFYPYQRTNSRRKDIESNLPFALTHMGAIAESGTAPYLIFKLISQFNEYGEVSKEVGKVVRNVDTFGLDELTAVKEVAKRTPSPDLKQILMGFITTIESGGDLKLFLKNAGEQALFNWRIKREKFLQQLSMYAEFYTGVLIAAPLFIVSLFAVMSFIQPNLGGFDILTLTQLSIYGLIPAINVVFLMFIKGMEVEI